MVWRRVNVSFQREVTSHRTLSQYVDKKGSGWGTWIFKKPAGKIPQEQLLLKQPCGPEGSVIALTPWFTERKQQRVITAECPNVSTGTCVGQQNHHLFENNHIYC